MAIWTPPAAAAAAAVTVDVVHSRPARLRNVRRRQIAENWLSQRVRSGRDRDGEHHFWEGLLKNKNGQAEYLIIHANISGVETDQSI